MTRTIAMVLLTALMMTFVACTPQSPKTIVVASKPHAEQYILAEMISLLIESHTDIKVEKKIGIGGGTANIHPAMMNGEIDIYPEYTGTGLLFVLKDDLITDPAKLYDSVKARYLEEYNLQWMGLYGFNNTYALTVKATTAEKYKLETYDDLALASKDLVFGAEYDFFEREDGYEALKNMYSFEFKDTKEMDIGLKYQALESDEVDVINAFSTDGLIKQYGLKVLKDSKNFFPSYQAATVIRKETLDKYPELEGVLEKLTGQISDQEMIDMNYQVEKENKDPKDVAEKFLKDKGLI